jgi:hypothetical protein
VAAIRDWFIAYRNKYLRKYIIRVIVSRVKISFQVQVQVRRTGMPRPLSLTEGQVPPGLADSAIMMPVMDSESVAGMDYDGCGPGRRRDGWPRIMMDGWMDGWMIEGLSRTGTERPDSDPGH